MTPLGESLGPILDAMAAWGAARTPTDGVR
jgi:DNA-binding HxlR family transcriptional regulator